MFETVLPRNKSESTVKEGDNILKLKRDVDRSIETFSECFDQVYRIFPEFLLDVITRLSNRTQAVVIVDDKTKIGKKNKDVFKKLLL